MTARSREQFSLSDRECLKAAADDVRFRDCSELTVPVLRELALNEGIEFATAVVYDRVQRKPRNRAFWNLLAEPQETRIDRHALFAIVPGAFYRMHKNSGADGGRLVAMLEEAGARVATIPIENFGRVHDNARIIANWLQARRHEKVVILSLSKGAADAKEALREFPEIADDLLGWVSLSGIWSGTPLVNWLQRQRWRMLAVRLLFWWRGLSMEALHDLCWSGDRSNSQTDGSGILNELPVLHVCGFPLQHHLAHPWAPKGYRRLTSLGPNDGGGILLGEVAQRPGLVLPIWGADHYLAPSWDCEAQFMKVLALAAAGALRPCQASRCEMPPMSAPPSRSAT